MADSTSRANGPWLSRPSASRTGMYGSRWAYCSTLWPIAISTGSGAAATAFTKLSTRALLPIPASPWTKTA